jgi:hypothetical protein
LREGGKAQSSFPNGVCGSLQDQSDRVVMVAIEQWM